jgi:hypothetical protein
VPERREAKIIESVTGVLKMGLSLRRHAPILATVRLVRNIFDIDILVLIAFGHIGSGRNRLLDFS